MQSWRLKMTRIFWFFVLLSAAGCATGLKSIESEGPVNLQFKAVSGREEINQYRSSSYYEDFEEGQLVREKHEIVDFTIRSMVKGVDPKDKSIVVEIATTSKDGLVDLHDLAFPELNEVLEVIYSSTGEVLRAGDYPPTSVFYVPPISLPQEPVSVGDTWEFSKSWSGAKSGALTRVEIASILKGIYNCGPVGRCVEVEISGHVVFPTLDESKARFNSELWGRYLYAYEKGSVLWSKVHSEEQFLTKSGRKDIWSCMVSFLKEPAAEGIKKAQSLECDPKAPAPAQVPGI